MGHQVPSGSKPWISTIYHWRLKPWVTRSNGGQSHGYALGPIAGQSMGNHQVLWGSKPWTHQVPLEAKSWVTIRSYGGQSHGYSPGPIGGQIMGNHQVLWGVKAMDTHQVPLEDKTIDNQVPWGPRHR